MKLPQSKCTGQPKPFTNITDQGTGDIYKGTAKNTSGSQLLTWLLSRGGKEELFTSA